MINEDYVNFIKQKYRLAIAIAVIKSKPENKTMEDYINDSKRTFIEINNCKVSVCEEDFNLSDNESDHSATILKDFAFDNVEDIIQNENACSQANNFNIETSVKNIQNINSQSTYYETPDDTSINLDDNTHFSLNQDAILENTITNMNKNPTNDLRTTTQFYTELTDEHTHISQSQDNFIICNKHLLSNKASTSGESAMQNKLNVYINNNNYSQKQITSFNLSNEHLKTIDKMDIVETKNMNRSNFLITQNILAGECVESSQNILANHLNSNNSRINSNLLPLDLSSNTNDNNQIKKLKKPTSFSQNLDELGYFTDSSQITLNSIQNFTTTKDIHPNLDKPNIENKEIKIDDILDRTRKVCDTNLDTNNNVEQPKTLNNNLQVNKDTKIQDFNSITDVTESQTEVVTFKVLEELNKVKNYLSRRESERWRNSQLDTFSRVSDTMSMSLSSVNESAQCLLRHITSDVLLSRTAHITSHAAEVLGDLINTLHEDEKYPNFLETLLDTIDNLLHYIYEGDNCEENIIIKKEQAINRLLYLNSSLYIIEYTIQKITTILNKFTQDIKNEMFEIQYPDKIENICHIFHILEVILHRNTKSQANTQKSLNLNQSQTQELKKSALTDVWRKKWCGKESVSEKGAESEGRVLKECSGVLRVLLVEAISGFNLVAFLALKCYNLLQD